MQIHTTETKCSTLLRYHWHHIAFISPEINLSLAPSTKLVHLVSSLHHPLSNMQQAWERGEAILTPSPKEERAWSQKSPSSLCSSPCYLVLDLHRHLDLLLIWVPTETTLELHGNMIFLPQEWLWSRISWVTRITALSTQLFSAQPSLQGPSIFTVIQGSAYCEHRATVSSPSQGFTTSFLPKIK